MSNSTTKEKEYSLTLDQVSSELERVQYKNRFWMIFRNTAYVLMAVSATAILIAVLWLPVLRIYGQSMNKTLQEGDVVMTVKGSQFETGDVIAFYYNNKVLVKRVIAQPGDWVDVDLDGNVYVNQKLLEEPYVMEKAYGESNITYPYQVPDQQIFVMGDNRKTSIDSRNTSIGGVSQEQIVGKIILRIWPLSSAGRVK